MDWLNCLASILRVLSTDSLAVILLGILGLLLVPGLLYLLFAFPFLGDKARKDVKDVLDKIIGFAKVVRGQP